MTATIQAYQDVRLHRGSWYFDRYLLYTISKYKIEKEMVDDYNFSTKNNELISEEEYKITLRDISENDELYYLWINYNKDLSKEDKRRIVEYYMSKHQRQCAES